MVREDKATWKSKYFTKIIQLLDEYPKVFIVSADNVGSKQMQQIRISLRGKGELLMGKNTMMRKAIRGHLENNPDLEKLLPHIKENVGFVFTKEDLKVVRDVIRENRAKAGAIAPIDVKVSPINTGLGPEKTSFFQALAIPTKITRGKIEILREVHLIHKDEKVGASEATLLKMLKISPFSYGLQIQQVYEAGCVYSPNVLDITEDDILSKFIQGIANVATMSLVICHPTAASVPHSVANGFKNVIAVALETDITFPAVEQLKAYLEDPSAFAPAPPAASAGGSDAADETPEETEEEEESDDEFPNIFWD